jgi:hypothetical protein
VGRPFRSCSCPRRECPAVARHPITGALLLLTLMSACGDPRAGPSGASSKRSQGARGDLTFRRIGRLPAPVQLPSVVAAPRGGVLVVGGLSAADTSTDAIVLVGRSGSARTVGRLPLLGPRQPIGLSRLQTDHQLNANRVRDPLQCLNGDPVVAGFGPRDHCMVRAGSLC